MTRPDWLSGERTQITIDGRTYASVDDMPPEARQRFEQAMRAFDRDGNGVPDVQEGAPPDPNVISHVSTSERIVINGREYGSWEEVPREFRRLVDGGGLPRGGVSFRLNAGALAVLLVLAALFGGLLVWVALR